MPLDGHEPASHRLLLQQPMCTCAEPAEVRWSVVALTQHTQDQTAAPASPIVAGTAPPQQRWRIEVRHRQDRTARLAHDVRTGLAEDPPSIPPKWFYDETGSLLFDEITRLPEYYPTRTEEQILLAHAADIAALSGASTMIELGAGYSRKTATLLDALTASGRPLLFVPLDIATEALRDTAKRVVAAHATVEVLALVADFEDDLDPLPGTPGERLVVFLGSTIGNLLQAQRAGFLQRLHAALAPGDCLLLGADLIKDPGRLVAAYDDAAGTTAAFNKNMLAVLARELDADIDLADLQHVAVWDAQEERIEMRLRARRDLTVKFRALGLHWSLGAGQDLLTETSTKFRTEGLRQELQATGLDIVDTYTDAADDFCLVLARRS